LGNTNPLKIALFLGLAAMLAGAFLPWTKIGPFSASGTEGDGLVTLVLALGGGVIAFFGRRPRAIIIATSAAGLALIVAFLSYIDVSGGQEVGSGLYLTLAGGLVATAAGSMLFFRILKVPGASPPGSHA
jgi:hypothetical protein